MITRELLGQLGALGDENRLRLLSVLERHEFSVSELVSIVQLPQPTVSRHLKLLANEDWIRGRRDGTSRHYRMSSELDRSPREMWRLVRESVEGEPWVAQDLERADVVLAARSERARRFFSETATSWDTLRTELFGPQSEWSFLFGLLEPDWVVGDLGAGTGALASVLAPFVGRVIAVDRSPEMLAAAESRLASIDNVEVREGNLEALPIEPESLDLALMVLTLHFTAEPRRALEEAHEALGPGGRLIVVDMRDHDREEYRETMGHMWMGFAELDMSLWVAEAGFGSYRHAELSPDPSAGGPLLFVGTARKRS